MKRSLKQLLCLVGALLLAAGIAWSQPTDDTIKSWLQEYIDARNAGKDSAMPLVRINDYYKSGDTALRSTCREILKAEIASQLRAGNKQTVLCLIELYDFIVTDPTDRAPELYFIEGNIYVERNDSVALKKAMHKIETLGRGEQFHEKLAVYLEKMRSYIPADKYLEGYWVTDERFAVTWRKVRYATSPFYLLKAEQIADTTRLTLLKGLTAGLYGEAEKQMRHPQLVIPYATDSLYILWSSERLRNINPEQVASYRNIVRETSAQASGIFAQRHQYSSSEQLGNQLITNLAEMGINSLISSLSTPKKTILMVEFRLKHINDRLYRGTRHYYLCIASADGKKQETHHTYPCNLYRWDKESGILFGNHQMEKNYFFYGHDKEEQIAAKEDKDGYYLQSYRNYKNHGLTTRRYFEYLEAFNTAQFRQLEIYNQRLLDPAQTPIIEIPEGMQMAGWLGLGGQKATPELAAEHKLTANAGVVVDSLYAASPALVAGLHKGDLVQRVNGKEINSIEALNQTIATFEPGAEITIEGERAGKPIRRLVRLSYQFVPIKE